MNVCVIGAGKMGLPLACQFAARGARVIACDKNKKVVEAVNRGVSLIDEPGVQKLLMKAVKKGKLKATTEIEDAVEKCEVVIVIVPVLTTKGKDADISAIEAVTRKIAAKLRPGTMVSYETTLPVGTTRGLLKILESSGLKGGKDFDLVFSPERVKSQFVLKRLTKNPKVVGGITTGAARRAADFYRKYLGAKIIDVGTLEAAEMVKLAGMVYRDVNIALSNELARYVDEVGGMNILEIIKAANTDGEAALLAPGIGVGGHCTPVYPYFLIKGGEKIGFSFRLIGDGRKINESQPAYVLDRIEKVYGDLKRKKVMILGLAFRPQVREHICSPVFDLAEELKKRGAEVKVEDPLYTDAEISSFGFTPGKMSDRRVAEIIILNTAHDVFTKIDFRKLFKRGVKILVDGRNAWDREKVQRSGMKYIGIGS